MTAGGEIDFGPLGIAVGHATDKIAREIRRLVGRAAPPLFAEP